MYKIVHLQTLISFQGNAPFRLHSAMLNSGLDSKMVVYTTPRASSHNFYRYSGLRKKVKTQFYQIIKKLVDRSKKPNTYLFSYAKYVGNDVSRHSFVVEADLIYLHWVVGGFLNLSNIEKLLKLGKPVVFFMHDMWPITGGCHHSFECTNYEIGCRNCPMFILDEKKSFASKQFDEKKALFSKYHNLFFLSPSKWLAECAAQSAILVNKRIEYIPNIVNEKVFKEFDKLAAKKILNIPDNTCTITFGSVAGKNNHFKGWSYLKEALHFIKERQPNLTINVLIFGCEYDENTTKEIPFDVKFLGEINDETTMVIINNATDVFVSPSLAESFGQTFLENVLCKTPVVGFNIGGVPDIIEHKINGYLAQYKSSDDLAEGILYCLQNALVFEPPKKFFTAETISKHLDFINLIMHDI